MGIVTGVLPFVQQTAVRRSVAARSSARAVARVAATSRAAASAAASSASAAGRFSSSRAAAAADSSWAATAARRASSAEARPGSRGLDTAVPGFGEEEVLEEGERLESAVFEGFALELGELFAGI